MSSRLRRFLADSYLGEKDIVTGDVKKDYALQIDDQDDNDDLTQFCNMFVTVGKGGCFVFELLGQIPLTQDIVDLAEIYGGAAERSPGRLMMRLNISQIEVLMDLAKKIHKTSRQGNAIGNPNWHRISARTISSIYRFVRTIKEYTKIKGQIA